jgi:predicted lipoprotein with Yx(FWY)xxD motif
MIRFLTVLAAAAALAFAGCGGDDDDSGDEAAAGGETETATAVEETTETQPAQAAAGTTIKLADSEFGQILFDDTDQAIYLFEKEKSDRSECYGACAEAWPPVLTEGEPQAAQGVKQGLLGTTQRDDGSTQVTYNGHPLYYYVDDGKGEVKCHNVNEFGGLWLVVDPAGNAV